jgi:hypothetical protein
MTGVAIAAGTMRATNSAAMNRDNEVRMERVFLSLGLVRNYGSIAVNNLVPSASEHPQDNCQKNESGFSVCEKEMWSAERAS